MTPPRRISRLGRGGGFKAPQTNFGRDSARLRRVPPKIIFNEMRICENENWICKIQFGT